MDRHVEDFAESVTRWPDWLRCPWLDLRWVLQQLHGLQEGHLMARVLSWSPQFRNSILDLANSLRCCLMVVLSAPNSIVWSPLPKMEIGEPKCTFAI